MAENPEADTTNTIILLFFFTALEMNFLRAFCHYYA